jgi:hypothetical protein
MDTAKAPFRRNVRSSSARACLALFPLLALTLIWPHRTRSQTTAPSAAPAALPQRVVYKQVFQHLVFLDYQADLADQHGKNGNALRNYYQTHAALTASESALLKNTAHDAVVSIKALDQQIQASVALFRGQFARGKWPKGQPLPVPPPELQTLQTAKDNVILGHVSTLQSGFGASRFQHLDSFIQANIAQHITLATIPTAGPKTADQGKTLPQLPPIPWMK